MQRRQLGKPLTMGVAHIRSGSNTACQHYAVAVARFVSELHVDTNRHFAIKYNIDGAVQTFAAKLFQTRSLYLTHSRTTAVRAVQSKMYDSMRVYGVLLDLHDQRRLPNRKQPSKVFLEKSRDQTTS